MGELLRSVPLLPIQHIRVHKMRKIPLSVAVDLGIDLREYLFSQYSDIC